MIIRLTPTELDNFIRVKDEASKIIHSNGFIPKYMDNEYIYYVKTQTLLDFIKKEGLNV